MDFRSQLSAFKSGGGSSGGGSRGGNNAGGGNDRSPHRPPNNRDNRGDARGDNRGDARGDNRGDQYNNNNNNNRDNSRDNYYGRGGGGGGGGGGRSRPRDWDPQQYHQGREGPPPHARRRFQSPERDGLGDLRHHGYKVPRGIPPEPTPEERKRTTKHLALLVICIEDLPYEHIWKAWCQTLQAVRGNDDYHISLVCHAKYPKQIKSEWLRKRLLVHSPKSGRGNSYLDPEFLTRTPNWGSVEITRAMLDLLQSGLKIGQDKEADMRFSADRFLVRRPPLAPTAEQEDVIPPVDQFLYVSETCLPVATAQEFFDTIKDTTVSWVNAHHRKDSDTPKNAYESDQFGLINRRIPGQYRWKADQWVLLCRNHASQIIGLDRPHISYKYHLWQSYRDINASDEMYMPTSLALLGFLRFAADGEDTQRSRSNSTADDTKPNAPSKIVDGSSPSSSNTYEFVKKRPITYTDWSVGMRNPATFAQGVVDFRRVAQLAREKGCLMARKFAPFISVPGQSNRDRPITGQISADEWKLEIEKLKAEQKAKKPVAVTSSTTTKTKTMAKEPKDTIKVNKNDDSEEEEPEESFIGKSGDAATKQGEEENTKDDDDDEETQLE